MKLEQAVWSIVSIGSFPQDSEEQLRRSYTFTSISIRFEMISFVIGVWMWKEFNNRESTSHGQ